MRKIVLIGFILLCTFGASLSAQDISYHYDNAGNRTERVIELRSAYVSKSAIQEQQVFEETLAQQEIKIYPNPTEGMLSVSISNPGNLPEGTITLTDMNGRKILTRRIENGLTSVDLSSHPAGYYLMKITLGAETSTWKIIKK
ncbi:T9SS type A sorting domain-containing protein [Gaoshiqia sp. Z1-71]|uniref:T9SS type A sorting domain-containing protein n=1 Tax=Gaoshiqia hydrogeniformans TaxID=3290090 RepID=UPI003BF8E378